MSFSVACIGGAHLDRTARAEGPVVLGSSNPVGLQQTPGGVARNVAENLARLGAAVSILSAVGEDEAGAWVLTRSAAAGIDTTQIARLPGRATASYTALLDPAGEMVVGFADMAIYTALDGIFCTARLRRLPACSLWFVDANLPAEGIAAVCAAKPAGTLLAADCVSVAKSRRLMGLVERIDLLFCNADEATALAGLPEGGDPAKAAARLRSAGAGAVVVTRGAAGCLLASPAGIETLPAVPVAVRDVTGAGDALIGGTLFGLGSGRPLRDALDLGMVAAAITLGYDGAVHPDLGARLSAWAAKVS